MSRISCRLFFLIAISIGLDVQFAQADETQINFDVASIIECYDVTDPPDKPLPSEGRLIHIPIVVSADVSRAARSKIRQIRIEVQFMQADNEVFDYLPRTHSHSDIQGSINIEENDEKNANFGLNISGSHEPISANSNAGASKKTRHSKRFSQLPKQQLVAATGTINRRTGVFFKFLPSTQEAWDAERHLAIMARVPENWRAGMVRIKVTATGDEKIIPGVSDQVTLSKATFFVPFVKTGDREAASLVRQFLRQDLNAKRMIAQQSQSKNVFKNSWRELKGLIEDQPEPLRQSDLERWMIRPQISKSDKSRLQKLDDDERRLVAQWISLRRGILAMNSDVRLARTEKTEKSRK
jgi:hypothetical protein